MTSIMAHEAEIIIPGSFVVLQGSAGDGVRNTVNSQPVPVAKWFLPPPLLSESCSEGQAMKGVSSPTPATTTLTTVGQLAAQNTTLGGLTGMSNATTISSTPRKSAVIQDHPSSSPLESYVVVTDHEGLPSQEDDEEMSATQVAASANSAHGSNVASPLPSTSSGRPKLTRHAKRALDEWRQDCHDKEGLQYREWKESVTQMLAGPLDHTFMRRSPCQSSDGWWLTAQGKIAILRDLPTQLVGTGAVLKSVIGTLSPGCTIVATEIVYLDSRTLQRLKISPQSSNGGTTIPHSIFPRGRSGWICMVKVEADTMGGVRRSGYACLSVDGYPLLAPGLPSLYTDPHAWVWRVTCPAGAYVRQGLDLNSQHLDTLPYGSLVRVTRRTINGQGLSRLRVSAVVEDPAGPRQVNGWCSECLNPLSGNRGSVLEPLAFPVPALYRVTLPLGAVIRGDVELSTPTVDVVPMGTILPIVGRAYTEHPMDQCIERLELAGNRGWISVRLNRPSPDDDLVVELVDTDSRFDPDQPEVYHWECFREQQRQNQNNGSYDDSRELSSVDTTSDDASIPFDPMSSPTARTRKLPSNPYTPSHRSCISSSSKLPARFAEDKCLICLTEERNATIVHGETGHVACCLVCARILKARGDKCPVCRLNIDLVIQQFWA